MSQSMTIRPGDKPGYTAAEYASNLRWLDGPQDVAALLASETSYAPGDTIVTRAEGFRYRVMAAVEPNEHLTTAGGTRLEVLPGPDGAYNLRAFNPAADGSTNDYPVLLKALNAGVVGNSGPTILVPGGTYYLADNTVSIVRPTRLIGEAGTRATFRWAAGTPGVIFRSGNEQTPVGDAGGTVIRGIDFRGGGNATGAADGLWMRTGVSLEDVKVSHFSGSGIKIYAWVAGEAPGSPQIWGNANNWRLFKVNVQWCGLHGLHVQGSDVNGGVCIGGDFSLNGRSGVYDNSFLGNTYIGCHSATNGTINAGANASRGASCAVSYNGIRCSAAFGATEEQLVATPPGTNEAVWKQFGTGGAIDWIGNWLPDQPVGTYFVAAPYWLTNANARTVMIGCYSESDGGGVIVDGGLITVIGGTMEWFNKGGQMVGGASGALRVPSVSFSRPSGVKTVIPGSQPNAAIEWSHTGDGPWPWALEYLSGDWALRNGGASARVPAYITSVDTSRQMGTSAAVPYLMVFPIFGLGSGNNARRITSGTAAPTEGEWAKGDRVFNINATAGGHEGWVCVTAGTPGEWRAFGAISD